MNKKLRCVIILVGLTFFNGCVGQQPIKYFVESNVTSFHNIKGKVENTVRVLPFD